MRSVMTLAVALLTAGAPQAAMAASPPAPPATPDPNALHEPGGMIRDLYTRYYAALNAMNDNPDAPFPDAFQFEAIAARYFTAALAARVNKALSSDEPVFDWDWLINGQDFGDLKVISVDTVTNDGAQSMVSIVTSNFGQQSTTGFDLVKTGAEWKIADVIFDLGESERLRMTDFLKEAGY